MNASIPFGSSPAQGLKSRRVLVLCASVGLHATVLYGIVLFARPALRDAPSPAIEMIFDAPPAEMAGAEPPVPAVPAPAPEVQTAPVPSAAQPVAPEPASAPGPEPIPVTTPAVALLRPPPRPPLQRRPAVHAHPVERALPQPAPETATPAPAVEAPRMAALPPAAAAPVLAPAPISSQWQGALGAWIRSRTRYPEEARRLMQQGAVIVSFTVGRDGEVWSARLAQRSGSELLDRAALGMFSAARVPAFPADMPQAQITISVPVRYRLEP